MSRIKSKNELKHSPSDNHEMSGGLCFPLYACSREIIKRYTPFLEKIDLTYTQYIAMMVLWEKKQISVKELGKCLFLDSGTLTPLLKKLEQKGYVTRTRSEEDERVLIAAITPKGEDLKDEAVLIPQKMMACAALSQEKAAQLYTLLYELLNTLEK